MTTKSKESENLPFKEFTDFIFLKDFVKLSPDEQKKFKTKVDFKVFSKNNQEDYLGSLNVVIAYEEKAKIDACIEYIVNLYYPNQKSYSVHY